MTVTRALVLLLPLVAAACTGVHAEPNGPVGAAAAQGLSANVNPETGARAGTSSGSSR